MKYIHGGTLDVIVVLMVFVTKCDQVPRGPGGGYLVPHCPHPSNGWFLQLSLQKKVKHHLMIHTYKII